MRERPILLRDDEVRAVLAGRKTQLRRPMKTQPEFDAARDEWTWAGRNGTAHWSGSHPPVACALHYGLLPACPYGRVGDRLWVREAWQVSSESNHYPTDEKRLYVGYRAGGFAGFGQAQSRFSIERDADLATRAWGKGRTGTWRPSIHMPRWACRTVLEITDVRIQRVQEIGEEDAAAEGFAEIRHERWTAYDPLTEGYPSFFRKPERPGLESIRRHEDFVTTAREQFERTWRDCYGPESWSASPWVWAVSFRRVTP